MASRLFEGSGVALVTPFSEQGIDEVVLRELVRFHLHEGTDALVINGSTGEAAVMPAEEQRLAVAIVVEEVRGSARGVPVIAGIGGSDTRVAERLARQAAEAGADALLVAPPPYNRPSQAGIVAHCRRIIDAGGLPTILYNVPSRTACNVLPATVEELATDPRLVGIKEASGDIVQIAEVARRLGDRLDIYSGNDDQVVPVLALGGVGVISVLANIAPRNVSRMVHAFLDGDLDTARSLQLRYLPLIRLLFSEPSPAPIKAALALAGWKVGDPRLPLLAVGDSTRESLADAMREVGLLTPAA